MLPLSVDIGKMLTGQFTGSVNATPDADRRGRHLNYAGDWGLGVQLSDALQFVGEVQVTQDDDPGGRTTQAIAAGSLAYQFKKRFQVDLLVGAGLNRDTPDLRIITGGAVLF